MNLKNLAVPECCLVIGAGSAIGQAILEQLSGAGCQHLLTVGRGEGEVSDHCRLNLTSSDSVAVLSTFLKQKRMEGIVPSWCFHCSGILHDGEYFPEKGLSSIKGEWLMKSMEVNVLSHVHAAQAVSSVISPTHPIRWASLSAMVGSIADNRVGGWHSYRMSKAALNMFIRGLDIEWRRKHRENRVVAIHPGATESELSRPFRQGLPPGRPFSAELTAQRMIQIMANLQEEQSGHLLHWDGSPLPF